MPEGTYARYTTLSKRDSWVERWRMCMEKGLHASLEEVCTRGEWRERVQKLDEVSFREEEVCGREKIKAIGRERWL